MILLFGQGIWVMAGKNMVADLHGTMRHETIVGVLPVPCSRGRLQRCLRCAKQEPNSGWM